MNKMAKKYSVKSTMWNNGRSKDVDGPWKPTVGEAIKAYTDMVEKKELTDRNISRSSSFVAERVEDKDAGSKDSRGVPYNTDKEATKDLAAALEKAGLKII